MANTTIQLGTTVYSATLNVTTGVLTVTHKGVDMGDLTWNYDAGTTRFYSGVISDIDTPRGDVVADVITELFKSTYANGQPTREDGTIAISASGAAWVYNTGSGTDKNAFASLVDGHMMVYKLATPTTLQLTPAQLELLKGYNRVSIESGTITLDYVAKAISGNDEEIAPLVGDKATKSYAVNDFIERADGLYRVTAPIASGASFTANNTVKMSIGEALTYLYNK